MACRNQRGLKNVKHKLKFIVRCLSSPRLTQAWFELWKAPALAPLLQSHPRVLLKLQRCYLRSGFATRARWQMLQQHYCFTSKHLSSAALREIFTPAGVLLAEIPAAGVNHYSVRLFYHDAYEKEGELSLIFYDEQIRERAFVLSFCVSSCCPGRREIFIGGLQGFKAANERESVVAITRGMFGLRPKALLLFALQQCALHWNVHAIYAVSNKTRIHSPKHRAINADYGQFWIESSGQFDADGDFVLPAAFVPRNVETIRPNKRTLYRRRYEMLDTLGETIKKNLAGLRGQ